jgi:large subunit ribosomal protein L10
MEKNAKQIGRLYKTKMLDELVAKLDRSQGLLVLSLSYLNVQKQRELRAKVRKADAKLLVVKNSLAKRALEKLHKKELVDSMSGTTAILTTAGDSIKLCKAVADFMKDNQGLSIKRSWIEGEFIDGSGVRELASLPSREVLLAQAFSGMKAPVNSFVYLLNNLITKFVIVLENIGKKKEQ